MNDLLLIAVPLREINYPPMSLPLLKSICHERGYKVALSDANLEYWKDCKNEKAFLQNTINIQNIKPVTMEELENSHFGKWTRDYVGRLLEKTKPRVIGLSVFSYISNLAAYYMGRVIREMAPAGTTMFIGGYGASSPLNFAEAIGAPERDNLAQTMRDEGIIDSYILGDGEEAIVEFMQTLENADPDKVNKIKAFTEMPYPDYSDLDLSSYPYANNTTLPVTGSKGCVRRCKFCDIPGLYGKYKQRAGKDIALECIHHYETHGAKTLYLTDSLVNGSMKSFLEFISTLAELKAKKNIKDMQWTGQYITRPAHQIPHNKDYYPLMAESGAVGLSVGAESGSNKVLDEMDKKMTVEDLFIELDYFRKYGITMVPNILPSYPTETREDFELTLKMIRDFQPYVADGTLEKIGGIARWYGADKLNWWGDKGPEHGWYVHKNDGQMWWYSKNPELTLTERVFRRLAISKALARLDMPVAMDEPYELKKMILWHESNNAKYDKWLSGIKQYKEWTTHA